MAQFVSVRLSRTDTSPWGFRLQGGKDFGQPLLIQKVNGGSLAEKAGLQVGDALVRVNNVDVQDLRHKEAQDTIVRAGNNFEIHVQRGGSTTWRPNVSPVGHVPSPGGRSPQTVTKTSLAAKPAASQIPSGHNISPKPFGPSSTPQVFRKGILRSLPRHFTPMNGGDSVKAIVNKQYNTPVGIYSEETIAETLSAQAEVLAGGVLGVNFMKNERTYDSQKSEVFKMLQEAEKEPKEPEPDHVSTFQPSTPLSTVNTPTIPITGLRHVAPPEAKPPSSPQASLAPGQNICADCERLIVGVFVRIKDKNLHVECFKCATCGTSLKNVGYYNINNKLYCDIHAKMVARQNPPAPNVDPITVPPGGRVPSGAFSSPSVTTNLPSSLSSGAPQSPPGTIAPMPFHAARLGISHVSPRLGYQSSNAPGPKPFGSQPAAPAPPSSIPFSAPAPPSSIPFSAPAPPISAPFSAPAPPVSNFSTPKPQTEIKEPVIWPPPSIISESKEPFTKKTDKVKIIEPVKQASKIPVLNVEDVDEKFDNKKRMSLCSEEVKHISDKKIEKSGISSIYESVGDANRPTSPNPDREITFSLVDEISKAQARSRSEQNKQIMSRQVYEQQLLSKSEHVSRRTKEESYLSTASCIEMEHAESRTVGGLRRSVSPEILDVTTKPHEVRSLLPPASAVRPLSPLQVVVFPPEIPEAMRSRSSSPQPPAVTELIVRYTPSPVSQITEDKQSKTVTQEDVSHLKEKKAHITREEKINVCEKKASMKEKKLQEKHKDEKLQIQEKKKLCEKETQIQEKKKLCEKETQEKKMEKKMYTKSEVERIVQEEVKKILLISEKKEESKEEDKQKSKIVGVNDLPAPIIESGKMASALTTASERPFTPVPFPKPMEIPSAAQKPNVIKMPVSQYPVPLPPYSKPYFPPAPPPPPEHEKENANLARCLREVGCRSPMTEALTTASDRPYSPLPTLTKIDTSAFKPIADIPKNKKPLTMLSALTIAPDVPFTLPGKTPIPSQTIFEEGNKEKSTPSAFKPLNGSVSGVIPKTAPLNKDLPVPYIPHPKVDSKFGMDKSLIQEPGMKKEVIQGFESTTAISDTSRYSRKSEFICESSKTQSQAQSQNRREIQKEVTRPITPIHSKPTSGLHSPSLLPYYQQNIGEIPVRNRSISPIPHPIRAPALTPTQIPPPRSPIPRVTTKSSSSAIQQRHQAYDRSQNRHYQTATCTETSRVSSESTASTKTITNISKSKQVFKPEPPPRQLSPHWRGDYVRSVQNLSPITVRLPSPQPRLSKPVGETSQETGAKIKIKKSRGQSPVVSYEEDTRHHSSFSKTTGGKGCQSGKGCSESDACKISESREKSASSSKAKSYGTSSHQQSKISQQHYKTQQLLHTEEVQQNKKIQEIEHTQKMHQSQLHQQKHIESQKQQSTSSNSPSQKQKQLSVAGSCKAEILDSHKKEYSSTSMSKSVGRSFNDENKAQGKSRISSSTKDYSYTGGKYEFQPGIPSSTSYPTTIKSSDPVSLTSSHGLCVVNPSSSGGHAGGGGGVGSGMPGSGKGGTIAGSTAPRRGKGVLNTSVPPGGRIPLCGHCNTQIRGPFITALGKIWCPEHFVCVNAKCRRPLQDIGFVEEADGLYCEYCFEQYLAPTCDKCNAKIKGDCLNAIGKHFHPECFRCAYCEKLFGNNPFFLEDALPYCETDWNELFTTKCFSCGFPIEAGDRWVEALSNNYHSQCFNCTMCKKNLEGQSFYAKGGRPYCKNHAR